jgi:hypothetical protein
MKLETSPLIQENKTQITYMKKYVLNLLIVITTFILFSCSNKEEYQKDKVLSYLQTKYFKDDICYQSKYDANQYIFTNMNSILNELEEIGYFSSSPEFKTTLLNLYLDNAHSDILNDILKTEPKVYGYIISFDSKEKPYFSISRFGRSINGCINESNVTEKIIKEFDNGWKKEQEVVFYNAQEKQQQPYIIYNSIANNYTDGIYKKERFREHFSCFATDSGFYFIEEPVMPNPFTTFAVNAIVVKLNREGVVQWKYYLPNVSENKAGTSFKIIKGINVYEKNSKVNLEIKYDLATIQNGDCKATYYGQAIMEDGTNLYLCSREKEKYKFKRYIISLDGKLEDSTDIKDELIYKFPENYSFNGLVVKNNKTNTSFEYINFIAKKFCGGDTLYNKILNDRNLSEQYKDMFYGIKKFVPNPDFYGYNPESKLFFSLFMYTDVGKKPTYYFMTTDSLGNFKTIIPKVTNK